MPPGSKIVPQVLIITTPGRGKLLIPLKQRFFENLISPNRNWGIMEDALEIYHFLLLWFFFCFVVLFLKTFS